MVLCVFTLSCWPLLVGKQLKAALLGASAVAKWQVTFFFDRGAALFS